MNEVSDGPSPPDHRAAGSALHERRDGSRVTP